MVSFNAKFGYLILNCQEIISWLLDKRREIQENCDPCRKQTVMFVTDLTI